MLTKQPLLATCLLTLSLFGFTTARATEDNLVFTMSVNTLTFAKESFETVNTDWVFAYGSETTQDGVLRAVLEVASGTSLRQAHGALTIRFELSDGFRFADRTVLEHTIQEEELDMLVIDSADFLFEEEDEDGASLNFSVQNGGTARDSFVQLSITGTAGTDAGELLLEEGDRITFSIPGLSGTSQNGFGRELDSGNLLLQVPSFDTRATPHPELTEQLLTSADRFNLQLIARDLVFDTEDFTQVTGASRVDVIDMSNPNLTTAAGLIGIVGYTLSPALGASGVVDSQFKQSDSIEVRLSGTIADQARYFPYIDLDGDLVVDATPEIGIWDGDGWMWELEGVSDTANERPYHHVTPLENSVRYIILERAGLGDAAEWLPGEFSIRLTMNLVDRAEDLSIFAEGMVTVDGLHQAGIVSGIPNCSYEHPVNIYVSNDTDRPLNLWVRGQDDAGTVLRQRRVNLTLIREDEGAIPIVRPRETLELPLNKLEQLFFGPSAANNMPDDGTVCDPDGPGVSTWEGRAEFTFYADGDISLLPMVETTNNGELPWLGVTGEGD